jgi:hypothetical protein
MHDKGIFFCKAFLKTQMRNRNTSLHISAIRLNFNFVLSNNVEKNNVLQAISLSLQHKKSHL